MHSILESTINIKSLYSVFILLPKSKNAMKCVCVALGRDGGGHLYFMMPVKHLTSFCH